jgi:hypothetical protein
VVAPMVLASGGRRGLAMGSGTGRLVRRGGSGGRIGRRVRLRSSPDHKGSRGDQKGSLAHHRIPMSGSAAPPTAQPSTNKIISRTGAFFGAAPVWPAEAAGIAEARPAAESGGAVSPRRR